MRETTFLLLLSSALIFSQGTHAEIPACDPDFRPIERNVGMEFWPDEASAVRSGLPDRSYRRWQVVGNAEVTYVVSRDGDVVHPEVISSSARSLVLNLDLGSLFSEKAVEIVKGFTYPSIPAVCSTSESITWETDDPA